jgi:PAS domain S-box-containing protein
LDEPVKANTPPVTPDAAAHFAAIVASSDDAIISKNLDGIVTSWNAGAERLFGYTAEEIIGRPVLTLIPADRRDEEPGIIERIRRGDRIEHYETIRQRKDGSAVHISLTVSPIRDARGIVVGASKIARDITQRRKADEQLRRQTQILATLNRVSEIISRDLDLERIVQSVTDLGVELSGAKFGAFFYNVANEAGESYLLYALSGAPRAAFEKFGLPRNTAVFEPTFRGDGVVRIDDIRSDPRYGKSAPHHGMPKGHLPVVSYLAVPVVSSSGEVIGGLFFGHDAPGVFGVETEGLLVAVAAQAAVAMDNARLHRATQAEIAQRKKAEEAKELLLNEIKHRVKNTLGTVQAIASQTFRSASQEERSAFVARLHALSDAHDLLTQESWSTVGTRELIGRALAPFQQRDRLRFALEGPDFQLNPSNALLLAMLIHELGTNAVKYGALSNEAGKVAIVWSLCGEGPRCMLRLTWTERGGPPVMPPTKSGFGSQMIARTLRGEQGSAHFDYAPEGFACALQIKI